MRTALALSLFFAPSLASATVVMNMTRAEMTDLSSQVVRARVGSIRTVEERPGALATLIELEVLETYRGKSTPGDVLTMMQMGGKIGDFVQSIPGQSVFTPGEEVVLFLSAFGDRYVQVGIGLGRFVVERSADGVIAREDLGDVTFASAGKDGVVRIGAKPKAARLWLRDLAAELRSYQQREVR